jgi:hypothetical protein
MSRKKPGVERIATQEKRTIRELDELLFNEGSSDLAAESQGLPAPVGEMQRAYPEAYKAAHKLLSGIGEFAVIASISFKQAKKISEMIHSENEGLSSIQEILNMQPVNALTLVHLTRLERSRNSRAGADKKNMRHREIKKQVLEMWASGQYRTHSACALKACEKYSGKVSYDTAIKYLRGAPKPASRR